MHRQGEQLLARLPSSACTTTPAALSPSLCHNPHPGIHPALIADPPLCRLTSAEAGEGVSVAQAVAVDAASAVTAGAVGAAAAPRNSIVAWVYAGGRLRWWTGGGRRATGSAAAASNMIVSFAPLSMPSRRTGTSAGLADTGAANQGIVETDALAASARCAGVPW